MLRATKFGVGGMWLIESQYGHDCIDRGHSESRRIGLLSLDLPKFSLQCCDPPEADNDALCVRLQC